MIRHTRAITRQPGPNFAHGITTSNLGRPDFRLAQRQHTQYCSRLAELGIAVETLPPDSRYPDGCFVEDTAIVTERGVILTHPGDRTRSGETALIEQALLTHEWPRIIARIMPPATLDGGDVLRLGDTFIIAISKRTNATGAEQLTAALTQLDYTALTIELPANLLHLKTGVSFIGENTIIAWPSLATNNAFAGFNKIVPPAGECYAANALAVNGTVLIPANFDGVSRAVQRLGLDVVETPMTEFQKMDGGPTCLSLIS